MECEMNYLIEQEVEHQHTTPYTPKQKDIIERKKKCLLPKKTVSN